MESYELLTFFHIAVIVVGFGSTFSFPFLQAFAERQGVAATLLAQRAISRITTFLVLPASILTPLLGVGLIIELDYLDDFPAWLMAAITWYIVAFLIAVVVINPAVARAIQVLEAAPDGPDLPEEYLPLSKRLQMAGGLLGLSIIGIAFLMVWKP